MYDELQDNEGDSWADSDETTFGATLRRFLYIFIVFLIIIGLLSPSFRNILRGRQSNNTAPSQSAALPTPTQAPEAEVIEETVEAEAEETLGGGDTAVDEPTSEEASPPPAFPINRIAVITNNGQVATIDPNGSGRVVLTSGDEQYQFPAWSPDGQYLASISTDSGRGSISIIEDDASLEPRRIYASLTEAPFYLYWAPDSQAISFLAENNDSPMALHLVDIEATVSDGSQKIATGGPFYWDWNLDSQRLFIHSGVSGGNARLAFITPDGEMQGDNVAEPGAFQAPDISADGRFVAYAAINGQGFSEIVIQNLETDEQSRFRHNGLTALSWSPTQNLLAYTSTPDPDRATFVGPLRVLDPQTGESKLLTEAPVLAYFWSPDGKSLAYYTLAEGQSDDFNAFFDNQRLGKGAELAKVASQFNLPDFELTIVNVETGQGRVVMTGFVPSFSFVTQFLPFFDQYALSHSLWSPASDAFLVSFLDEGVPKIAVVPARGGRVRVLTDGRIAFWSRQ